MNPRSPADAPASNAPPALSFTPTPTVARGLSPQRQPRWDRLVVAAGLVLAAALLGVCLMDWLDARPRRTSTAGRTPESTDDGETDSSNDSAAAETAANRPAASNRASIPTAPLPTAENRAAPDAESRRGHTTATRDNAPRTSALLPSTSKRVYPLPTPSPWNLDRLRILRGFESLERSRPDAASPDSGLDSLADAQRRAALGKATPLAERWISELMQTRSAVMAVLLLTDADPTIRRVAWALLGSLVVDAPELIAACLPAPDWPKSLRGDVDLVALAEAIRRNPSPAGAEWLARMVDLTNPRRDAEAPALLAALWYVTGVDSRDWTAHAHEWLRADRSRQRGLVVIALATPTGDIVAGGGGRQVAPVDRQDPEPVSVCTWPGLRVSAPVAYEVAHPMLDDLRAAALKSPAEWLAQIGEWRTNRPTLAAVPIIMKALERWPIDGERRLQMDRPDDVMALTETARPELTPVIARLAVALGEIMQSGERIPADGTTVMATAAVADYFSAVGPLGGVDAVVALRSLLAGVERFSSTPKTRLQSRVLAAIRSLDDPALIPDLLEWRDPAYRDEYALTMRSLTRHTLGTNSADADPRQWKRWLSANYPAAPK